MPADDTARVQLAEGCPAISDLLEKYRPYLRLLASRGLDRKLTARLSASDVVQQTMLHAFRDHGLFRGKTEAQFLAWLKVILTNNIAQAGRRHVLAGKRSVARENQPGSKSWQFDGREESPSAALLRGESSVILARAMGKLTEQQFEAIRLRYIEGFTLANIARKMECSQTAAAGLLKRGLRGLRTSLANENDR